MKLAGGQLVADGRPSSAQKGDFHMYILRKPHLFFGVLQVDGCRPRGLACEHDASLQDCRAVAEAFLAADQPPMRRQCKASAHA